MCNTISIMEEQLSYLSLARQIKYLRFGGLYKLDSKSPTTHKILHTIYMRGVLCFFIVYTIQQILKIHEVRGNMDKVMGTMFLLLTNMDCIYKISIFSTKPIQIEEIFNVLKGPIFNQREPEHRNILLDTVRQAFIVFRIFNSMCLFTCFLWVLHPTILHMQGKSVEFTVWLPFDVNSDPQYYIAVFYVWVQTTALAYCNSTMDIIIVFLLEQCRTQVSILRLDLVNLVEKSKKEAVETSCRYSYVLERRMKNIVKHHKEILSAADKIQDTFGGCTFCQFFVSGWILCTSVYRIVSVAPASIEFVSMVMYVVCILLQVYLYCYYGTELTYESEKLIQSAYTADWLEIPVKQRRYLITFMERIKKPICPMAGYIIPLSNATFISIVRSSFSFYAFLKNSGH
uniref:Odorant receptor n=1 Tax=Glyphodes pyloalis TaxID=1242752 RepID=A0A6M3GWL1_GLYPY|nr:olfactory receptor [Glyphodes pyloalis]